MGVWCLFIVGVVGCFVFVVVLFKLLRSSYEIFPFCFTDPNFCSECKRHLENVARNPVNRSDIDHVIGKLKSMIGFIS